MYICYIDESGTPDIPGNTSHFILAGLAIPIWQWKNCDSQIHQIKKRYGLEDSEMHVAWMMRPYREQRSISNFDELDHRQRRTQVQALRTAELLRLQRAHNPKLYKQTKKNYKQTEAYIHLSYDERKAFVKEVAQRLGGWGVARLFAECIDKVYFDSSRTWKVDEQAFEQLVSRFEQYLQNIKKGSTSDVSGLLIHDNNQTIAKKHTQIMKRFHQRGTLWTTVRHIIETPLFVDSQLTSMVQISDLCGYALRRYLENGEDELFDLIFHRADRKFDVVVGVRHFADKSCNCKICDAHTPKATAVIIATTDSASDEKPVEPPAEPTAG